MAHKHTCPECACVIAEGDFDCDLDRDHDYDLCVYHAAEQQIVATAERWAEGSSNQQITAGNVFHDLDNCDDDWRRGDLGRALAGLATRAKQLAMYNLVDKLSAAAVAPIGATKQTT